MKKILTLLLTVLSLAIFCNSATAQKDTSVYKTWDDLLARMKKNKKTDLAADPRTKAISNQWVVAINKTISTRPATEPWEEWTSTKQHPTEKPKVSVQRQRVIKNNLK